MEMAIIVVVFVLIALSGVRYSAKDALKKNGYPISWFLKHFQDIPNMYKLAALTADRSLRKKYYVMAILLTVVNVGILIICMVAFLSMI